MEKELKELETVIDKLLLYSESIKNAVFKNELIKSVQDLKNFNIGKGDYEKNIAEL